MVSTLLVRRYAVVRSVCAALVVAIGGIFTSYYALSQIQSEPGSSAPLHTNPLDDLSPDRAVLFAPGVVSQENSMEFGISFMPDGRTAYFTSQGEEFEHVVIYETRYRNGAWEEPRVASFSGEFFDADPFVSPDGERLYFFSMRPRSGDEPLDMPDIWYLAREGEKWSAPKPLDRPVNTPDSGEGFVTATAEGTLYFSSVPRTRSAGEHDIYRSRLVHGVFQEPEHLAIEIQTTFSNPMISPDEDFLIVDSRQPGGYGESDLYVSHREGSSWSTPRNLGPRVNTEAEEGTPSLSPDGRLLFFSRAGDIYVINMNAIE